MRATGEILQGKYRLIRLIGEGGMGAVYEAVHEQIGKRVAVKFLIGEGLADRLTLARFQREAQAAAAIGHHGIIDVYDIGEAEDGARFLVMEYLEGQPLSAYLDALGRLSPERTAFHACQVLSALDAAHGKGIVHRDLKPDNVFLQDVGRDVPEVKLLDFGISKIMDANLAGESITMTGAVLGTPFYMSPEQARGDKDLDHRIDLYAMGVILYECLTGRVPFPGTTYNQVLAMILTADLVEPSRYRPEIPPRMDEIVLRALDREPAKRYPSAEAMLEDLLPFVSPQLAGTISLSPRLRASAERSAAAGATLPTKRTIEAFPPAAARRGRAGETGDGAGQEISTADTVATGERVARLDIEPSEGAPSDEDAEEAPSDEDAEEAPSSEDAEGAPSNEEEEAPSTAETGGRRRAWALPAAVLAVVAAGLGLLWLSGHRPVAADDPTATRARSDGSAAVARPGDSTADGAARSEPAVVLTRPGEARDGGAPEVARSSAIQLAIEVDAPGARALVDGAAVPELPFTGRFPQDGLTHRVVVEAHGFEPFSELVTFDRDRRLRVTLRPRGRPGPRPGAPAEPTEVVEPTHEGRAREDPWRDDPPAGRPDGSRGRDDPWRE